MLHRLFACIACNAVFGLACTWVPLSSEGEQVQIAAPEFVEGCESIGETHASTVAKVGIFKRSEAKVQEELISLARNEAARVGATTISPLEAARNGEQTFGVFLCKGD